MEFASIVKNIAPWIGAAISGPVGPLVSMAAGAAAKALGANDNTVEAVQTALTGATQEQLLALKKADQDFQLQMQALGFKQVADLEAIAAGDRKDARAMQVALRSLVPAALTWFLVSAFVGTLCGLFMREVPAANRDVLVYMAGQLSGFTAAAVAFWLGTTRNSEDKTRLLVSGKP